MIKISGGVPNGWHGGQLPGAPAPFLFQFDAKGEAEVEGDIAQYLMSVPGPFAIVVDESNESEAPILDAPEDEQEGAQETSDPNDEKAKPKRTRRRQSLDE